MKTIAIVIGISHHQDCSFDSLPGAYADAVRFASALESWGMPRDWIYFVGNENATKANLIKTFYQCRSEFDVEAKLIFYFAGHGVREKYFDQAAPESSLICYDSRKDCLLETSLKLVELIQLIRMLRPVQSFLLIDACSLRLNQIGNFFNEGELLSTTNSKGVFCLFSSGIEKSYEDVTYKYGYFTNALLKSFAQLRNHKKANCHDLVKYVAAYLKKEDLPLPEAYHIGIEEMWPLQTVYHYDKVECSKEIKQQVLRREALAKLQDFLVTYPDPIIWMWGSGGMGKTIIAEQLIKRHVSAIYATIPNVFNSSIDIIQSIIEQIRSQKSELFFNRAPEITLSQIFTHISIHAHDTIIILDHLDRLPISFLETILAEIDRISLSTILISRNPCLKKLFPFKRGKILEWLVSPLNINEIEQILMQHELDPSFSTVLLNASEGNALKIRQMLAKMSGEEILVKEDLTEEYIKAMTIIAACGGFLDEQLFCQIFELKSSLLATFEKLGLIRYTKEGCYPHDILIDIVEEEKWKLDIQQACHYWNQQIRQTPFNLWACRSLVLLSSQIEDCTPFKESLAQCLETLNRRENINFLRDLVHIFKKAKWEELLLQASDDLIDHEEYHLAGDVLKDLLQSEKKAIRIHASKNDARRLVWLGQYAESLQLYSSILERSRSPSIVVPLKNNMGIAHFFSGNLDYALQLFQENIQYKGKKDERELGIAKHMTGMIMTYQGKNVAKAKKLVESGVQIFETTQSYLWNIVALNGLGDLCYRLEQWLQALYYLNRSKELADTLQNKTFLLFSLRNMARVYLRLRGPWNQELIQVVEEMEILLMQVLEGGPNWATVWAQNTLATIYAHWREEAKLQLILNEVVPLTIHHKDCHILTLSNLGHLAAIKNQFSEAKKYYEEAYAFAKELNNQFVIQELRQDFMGCAFPHELGKEFYQQE